jgi:hypothetical protein
MTMRLLVAGGIPALTDGLRTADADNPHGYFEFERVKHIKSDRTWLDDAAGRAVKIIHMLLLDLPDNREYRVLFMERDLREVVRSQEVMLSRAGKRGSGLSPERMTAMYTAQLAQVHTWLAARQRMKVLRVSHAGLIGSPTTEVRRIKEFLRPDFGELDKAAMVAAVDPSLHRNRTPERSAGHETGPNA